MFLRPSSFIKNTNDMSPPCLIIEKQMAAYRSAENGFWQEFIARRYSRGCGQKPTLYSGDKDGVRCTGALGAWDENWCNIRTVKRSEQISFKVYIRYKHSKALVFYTSEPPRLRTVQC
jgi:hypothetical protein